MMKGKGKGYLLLAVFLFLFSACQAWEDRRTVASVNGEAIKKKSYRLIFQTRYQGMLQSHAEMPPEMEQKLARKIIDEMINDVLYFQEAKKRNLVPSAEEVNKFMGHFKAGEALDPAFQKVLKEKGITMEELRTEMQRRMAINALQGELTKDLAATEQEAQEFYRKNRRLFYLPAEYKIGLLYAPDTAQAEKYGEELRTGKVGFEDLAAKNPSRLAPMTGTRPVWVAAENFSPEMSRAIKETKKGKISPPVKGMEGYYLIKVYDTKERRPRSFAEVKNDLIRNLTQEKRETFLADWLAQQKKKSVIEINPGRLQVKIEPPAPAKTGKNEKS